MTACHKCPNPTVWASVHERLLASARELGIEDIPPKPLILNGWVFSSSAEKHARWLETIDWAERCNLTHLTNLPECEYTIWEIPEDAWSPADLEEDEP